MNGPLKCSEEGFDAVGLKLHIQVPGWCEEYDKTPTVSQEQLTDKKN